MSIQARPKNEKNKQAAERICTHMIEHKLAYFVFTLSDLEAFLSEKISYKQTNTQLVYAEILAELSKNLTLKQKGEKGQSYIFFSKNIWQALPKPDRKSQKNELSRFLKKTLAQTKTAKKVEAKTEATTSIVKPQPQLQPPATDQHQIDQPFFDVIEKFKNTDLTKKIQILENLPTDFAKKNAKKIVAILFNGLPKDEAWTHFSKVFPKNKKSYLPITNAEILAVNKQHPELAHEFEQIDEKAVIESWFANQKNKQTQNLSLTKETPQ